MRSNVYYVETLLITIMKRNRPILRLGVAGRQVHGTDMIITVWTVRRFQVSLSASMEFRSGVGFVFLRELQTYAYAPGHSAVRVKKIRIAECEKSLMGGML